MLTFDDEPTINNAITKRLDAERGVRVCGVFVEPDFDCIRVGVLATLDDALVLRSRFDLPEQFEISHLHNEIDEIAEQYKAARADFWAKGKSLDIPEHQLAGTGLRGRWN
jgi:hypothetical protein